MGSDAHVMVVDAEPQHLPELLEWARQRIAELERLWSRFHPDSDLCRINSRAGQAVSVAPETVEVVRRAVEAWELTGGLFDPTVLTALEAAGYDRTFVKISDGPRTALVAPAPGCPGIDTGDGTVTVPAGIRLDLGGIGKGYAADLVAYELRTAGVAGALVNLGGDVRISGTPPTDDGWVVSVADPWREGEDLVALAVAEGAVATSSRLRRRWRRGGQEAHHLIDPRTGAPAVDGIAAVTVVAQQAHWAEILAKAALIAGPGAGVDLLAGHGAAGLIALRDTTLLRCGGLERYEAWTPNSGGISPAPAG
ncbi:MAG: FAD:protein FMN transferase [Streptomyces sp.]|nr:FAD:protein FMN transferase [Streptomyces sp.]NUQ97588.1 FAD:protein FMN transferase [Streptomyces sp.]NUS16907.1 FAD:protein FMN transferase [Streptomyces sp.]